jgi:Protein of unknown function (DUF3575)
MHGVAGVMTALVMTAASGAAAGECAGEGGSWWSRGRTYVGVAVPLAPEGFALEGERELDEQLTVTLGLRASFNLGPWSRVFGDAEPASLRWGLEPGVRFYVRGPAMDGMWFGPRLELTHAWEDSRREWNVGGAVLTGYSVRLSEGFTVQGALGLGATYQPALSALSALSAWTVTVGYRAQLSLGWSF